MNTPTKCRIGLTGGIGCGKSTVAQLFHELGVVVVDADAMSRALTAPGGLAIDQIRSAFGNRRDQPRRGHESREYEGLGFFRRQR